MSAQASPVRQLFAFMHDQFGWPVDMEATANNIVSALVIIALVFGRIKAFGLVRDVSKWFPKMSMEIWQEARGLLDPSLPGGLYIGDWFIGNFDGLDPGPGPNTAPTPPGYLFGGTDNMVKNGDFEIGDPPDNWTASRDEVEISRVTYSGGGHYMQVALPSGWGYAYQAGPDPQQFLGRMFRCYAWCFAPSTSAGTPYMDVYTSAVGHHGPLAIEVPKDDQWHYMKIEGVITLAMTEGAIRFCCNDDSFITDPSYLMVDDCRVYVV